MSIVDEVELVPDQADSRPASARRLTLIATAVALAGGLANLLLIQFGPYDLAGDEAHYWEWSRALDWSYYSKGPMVAWLIALSTRMLGDTELGVRLPAVLLGLGTLCLMADVASRLCGHPDQRHPSCGWARLWTVLLVGTQPMMMAGGFLMTIDAPFMFSWALATWALGRAMCDGWTPGWYIAGLAGAGGVLAKYTILLLAAGVVLYWIDQLAFRRTLDRQQRRQTLNVHAAAAVLMAAAGLIPIILWNSQNGWVSFLHVSHQTSDGSPISWWRPIETVLTQMLNPVTFVLAVIVLAKALRLRSAAESSSRLAYLQAFLSIFTFAFFVVAAVQTKVQPNWPVPWLVGAIPLVAAWLGGCRALGAAASRVGRRAAWVGVWVGTAIIVAGHLSPLLYRVGLPPKLDPTTDLRDWADLGAKVGRLRAIHGPLPIVCDDYQLASRVSFYTPGQPRCVVLQFGQRRQNQYDLWQQEELGVSAGGSAIVVSRYELSGSARTFFAEWLTPAEFELGFYRRSAGGRALTTTPLLLRVGRGFDRAAYEAAQRDRDAHRF